MKIRTIVTTILDFFLSNILRANGIHKNKPMMNTIAYLLKYFAKSPNQTFSPLPKNENSLAK